MARLMAYKLREFEKNTLTFEIGCSFLTFNFLEKRIDGAKMIQEVCKNLNVMAFTSSAETVHNQSYK